MYCDIYIRSKLNVMVTQFWMKMLFYMTPGIFDLAAT